ncbi:MAG: DUF58 domain-containing protein [Myxococcales bacterium]|nr:DUF58 domain-containing protein [Myxococcales bacterium]MCB9652430.1 DUF58 domain-containing protein [Deltaproteobacteria bacterium]
MRFIPGRALLLALMVPVVLALAALANSALVGPMLVADGVVVLLAVLDLLLVRRAGVEVTRSVRETVSLARPVVVTLEVKNLLSRKVAFSVNEGLFEHAAAEGLPLTVEVDAKVVRRATYRLTAMQRGEQVLGDHYVRYPSPGGFWIRQVRLPAETKLRVFPDVQAVRHYEMLARQNRDVMSSRLTRMRGGDTEFERLRDFLPDDEFRRIDWRATARRRKLTVREFQLEKNQNLVFMLDCGRMMTAEWDGLTALDYALNAVLMLSHVAIRRGDQVGLIAFDEKVTRIMKPRGGASASNQIIQATYNLFPSMVESDYDQAFRTLKLHMKKRTLVVFIGHAIDEQTARRIQALSRDLLPQHLPLCVLLRDRELEARALGRAHNHEEFCIQAAASEMLMWRDRLHREMQRAGVLVLDVLHNQLTGSLVTRYLEVKARGLI